MSYDVSHGMILVVIRPVFPPLKSPGNRTPIGLGPSFPVASDFFDSYPGRRMSEVRPRFAPRQTDFVPFAAWMHCWTQSEMEAVDMPLIYLLR